MGIIQNSLKTNFKTNNLAANVNVTPFLFHLYVLDSDLKLIDGYKYTATH